MLFDTMNSQYFKSLSDDEKNNVVRSGLVFKSEEDLRKYIENLGE